VENGSALTTKVEKLVVLVPEQGGAGVEGGAPRSFPKRWRFSPLQW